MMNHKAFNKIESGENKYFSASFYGLGIAPKILEILERIKFKVPTPIQAKAIPMAIQGKDVIGIAQTGTGKKSRQLSNLPKNRRLCTNRFLRQMTQLKLLMARLPNLLARLILLIVKKAK